MHLGKIAYLMIGSDNKPQVTSLFPIAAVSESSGNIIMKTAEHFAQILLPFVTIF